MRLEPFRHAVVDGFLDGGLFERLRAAAASLPEAGWRRWTQDQGRFAVPLEALSPEAHEALVGPEFTRSLCAMWSERLRARGICPDELATSGEWEAVVCRDSAGFHLPPHLDRSEQAVSTLLYLAPDGLDAATGLALGTRLYVTGASGVPFSTVGYEPNRWLAFVPASDTLHGVTRTAGRRTVVNATLFVAGGRPPGARRSFVA